MSEGTSPSRDCFDPEEFVEELDTACAFRDHFEQIKVRELNMMKLPSCVVAQPCSAHPTGAPVAWTTSHDTMPLDSVLLRGTDASFPETMLGRHPPCPHLEMTPGQQRPRPLTNRFRGIQQQLRSPLRKSLGFIQRQTRPRCVRWRHAVSGHDSRRRIQQVIRGEKSL